MAFSRMGECRNNHFGECKSVGSLALCMAYAASGWGQLSGFAKLVSVEITPFTSVLIPITAGENAQEGIVLGQTLGLTGTELPFFP